MSRSLGLRGRLTATLLAVSALALVIAAVALLVPLDSLLRQDALRSLGEEARTAKPRFDAIPPEELRSGSPRLERAVRNLARQTSADVVVVDAHGRVLAATDVDPTDTFADVAQAIRDGRLVKGMATVGDEREAQAAVPIDSDSNPLGLGLRQSLQGIGAAGAVVARALVVAALIALAGALVAGAVMSGRLVRRLAALRDTSLRLGGPGPPVEVRDDGSRDEIGDLSRALATMQRRIREQEQARRTFVSTASHELRTPLASLRLMLHSARDELDRPEPDLDDMREQLARASGQTERLSRLAAELLDLSRLDAGVPLRAERVELGEVARSVVAEFEPSGAVLELTARQRQWATADPGGVAQIVRILLDNALAHGPAGTPIDVCVEPADGQPAITVRDRGPGVDAGDAERIFERFERGADSGGRSGFGLGLAIGRELAERMGGELELVAPGPGARFRLSLPG
jgi:signal transduction histidine kinase